MISMKHRYLIFGLLLFVAPQFASAQTFEISGWVPYWRTATGTIDTIAHLKDVSEVNPFVYTIKSDGTLLDNGLIDQEPWLSFNAAARAQNVRVIPTVMTGSGTLVHELLSDPLRRELLATRIALMVIGSNYDGVDIDFEGKKAETRDHFSAFLKSLSEKLPNKWLSCTIETRIPAEDRYYGTTIPSDFGNFANDLKEINKYCDQVKIMTYDQQRIDMKLAAEVDATGELHAPVADIRWVEKVINYMARDIDKSKIMIGMPTYGYEYAVTAYAGQEYVYDILWTFNPGYATPIAQERGITPTRNSSGEIFFTYIPNTTTQPPISGGISALLAASAASAFADQNNSNTTFRMLTWPDAQSLQQKIDLAKRLGVRGVAIFKWDGGQDPAMWNVIASAGATKQVAAPASATPTNPSTPSTPAAAITRELRVGSTGNDVKTLQRILNSATDTRVAASGVGSPGRESTTFGPATLAAIKKFQVKHGIAKPGVAGYGSVGPKTRAKLNQLLAAL
jgi:spore germination protein